MENGRNDAFPAGLRVLVVDDDPTWLKILEKMLKKCSYEVTKCCLATEALDMLRKRKDGFDIVISDVNMPDMDGFRLLEHVGLEMNLPVIMMSVDGEISRVMKGVLHGACDYLLKPIRMKELQNIWQHVLRKKIHGVKDIDFYEGSEGIQRMKNGLDTLDDSQLLAGGDLASPRKRKDSDNYELDDQDFSDAAAKRARVVWSVDLHQKFVNAVNQIGLDKVGPKKILDLMNVPWLTRENVASHLQKYRLYLSRLQNQGQPSFGATKQSDFSGLDPSPSFSFQSSTAVQQNNATSCSFGYSGNKMLVQDVSPEIQEVNSKVHVPILTATKSRRALTVDIPCLQNVDSGFGMGVSSSFGSGRNVNYTSLEPNTLPQYSWSEDNSMIQFTQPPKEHKQLRYIPGQKHHIQADLMQPSSSADLETLFNETVPPSDMKPLGTAYRNNHMRIVSPTAARGVDFVPVRPQTDTVNIEALNHVSTSIIPSSMKNSNFDQCCTANWGSRQNHSTMGNIGSPVNGTAGSSEMKPSCSAYRNNHVRIISPKADTLDHVPLRSQTNSVNAEGLNKMSMNLNPSLDHCHTANWGTQQHQSASSSEMKRFGAAYANNHVGIASPAEDKAEPVCVQPQSNSVNTADQNKMGTSIASPGLKPLSFDQSSTRTTNWGNQYHHSTVETGPIVASFEGGLHLPSLIDQGYIDNSGFNPLGFSDYLDPDLITDVPSHLLDTLRFNSDLVFDSIEYPIINEGLFIT